MATPCERFLNIQELLDQLTADLGLKDVSHLACTNRQLHQLCTPALFRNLQAVIVSRKGIPFSLVSRIFSTAPGMKAFARNAHHIRSLALGVHDLTCYYDSLLPVSDNIVSNTKGNNDPITPPRPSQPLPPPSPHDICSSQLVTSPPLTALRELSFKPFVNEYHKTLAHLCWLISTNPGLRAVDLSFEIDDVREGVRLGRAFTGLSEIQKLNISIYCEADIWLRLGSRLLFSCRPSIRQLTLTLQQYSSPKMSNDRLRAGEDRNDEDDEDGSGEMVTDRRQEPLVHLEELTFQDLHCYGQKAEATVRAIFARCPNIKKLDTNLKTGSPQIEAIGRFIGETCQKIESLDYTSLESEEQDLLPFRIMESLPAQQVTNFSYRGYLSCCSASVCNMSVQRHSASLSKIFIGATRGVEQISLESIFKECTVLEELIVELLYMRGYYISLDDAVEHPWVCTKLRRLQLAISRYELPSVDDEDPLPYYFRLVPITLSHAETEHFARLEKLYLRLGTLTELQELRLDTAPLDEYDNLDEERILERESFPAMLSCGDIETGQPGYLHHLAGLKKLKILKGAVSATTEEMVETMGWPEARWIESNWPRLQFAPFFGAKQQVTEPFRWLQDQRKSGPVQLRFRY